MQLAAPAPAPAPTTTTTAAPLAAAATRAVSAVSPTTTSPPTTVAAREAATTTVARAAPSSSPPTTAAPATTTTTTTAGVVITLPAALRPTQQSAVRTERGVASWFGAPAHTCAHRTLPFGTVIKVTRISTGVSTECTVDDRGPSDMSRLIDLSTDTFEHLADASVGLIEVVIEW